MTTCCPADTRATITDAAELLAAAAAYHGTRNTQPTSPRLEVTGLVLRDGSLRGADLTGINFANCDLAGCDLRDATLRDTHWTATHLAAAKLNRAQLQGAAFANNCDLEGALLGRADLTRATFTGCNLTAVDARGATFEQAVFASTTLMNANLSEASLRDAAGYQLDHTLVRNTEFSPNADDPWSVLRRTYTGPRFIVNLLLLVVFVLSLSGKAVTLLLLQMAESAPRITAGLAAYCEQHPCRDVTIIDVVFGLNPTLATTLFVIAAALYNLLRAFLTLGVAGLREAEERSGRSPFLRPAFVSRGFRAVCDLLAQAPACYGWMYWLHRFPMRLLWVAASISLVLAVWELLGASLRIPVL